MGTVDGFGVLREHTQAHRGELAAPVPHGLVAQCDAVKNGLAHGVSWQRPPASSQVLEERQALYLRIRLQRGLQPHLLILEV
ncbi:hypothetical protein D9M69_548040 [compost metagenome]